MKRNGLHSNNYLAESSGGLITSDSESSYMEDGEEKVLCPNCGSHIGYLAEDPSYEEEEDDIDGVSTTWARA